MVLDVELVRPQCGQVIRVIVEVLVKRKWGDVPRVDLPLGRFLAARRKTEVVCEVTKGFVRPMQEDVLNFWSTCQAQSDLWEK